MPTRKDFYEGLKMDYPNLPDDMIHLVIDMYEKDHDWIEQRIKEEKKKHKGKIPLPKTQLTLSEMETLHEKMKLIPEGRGEIIHAEEEQKSAIIVNNDDEASSSTITNELPEA